MIKRWEEENECMGKERGNVKTQESVEANKTWSIKQTIKLK